MAGWKKGRGKLGFLEPLIGEWTATAESPMGNIKCTRRFTKLRGDKWIVLDADWDIGGGKHYLEHAVIGLEAGGTVSFWSFTSDGKRSEGKLADGTDVHPEAIAFEAQMPAGLARMIYWPGDENSFNWAVESRTKKGWNRFTMHTYTKIQP